MNFYNISQIISQDSENYSIYYYNQKLKYLIILVIKKFLALFI
jgi:hypothetical protein